MLGRILPKGLRKQILVWSVLPTLVILVAVGFFSFWTYSRVTETLVMDRNRELTRLLAGQMGLELAEYADRLLSLAEARTATEGQEPVPWLLHLEAREPYLHDFDSGVVVLDHAGLVIAADPRRDDLLGQDWSGRGYFRRIQTQPEPVLLSDIEADGPDGGEVVAIAVPLLDASGQLSEVLVGLFAVQPDTASAFYRSLLRLDLRMESRVYLVDSRGRAIYHYDYARIGSDLSDLAAVQAVQAGFVGAWRGWAEDQEIVASYAPIPHTLCGLVEEESWAALRGIAWGYGRVLVLILLLGVLVPAGIVGVAMRRITRPIRQLTESARAISSGNMEQIQDVPTGNELGELARAFNEMAAQLEGYHAELEGRVAARTRELSAMNAIASVVSQSLDLHAILDAALGKVLELMGMSAGAAYEMEPGSDSWRLIVQRGSTAQALPEGHRVPLDEPETREWLAAGARAWQWEEFPFEGLVPTSGGERWQQVILVPLVSKGQLTGLLSLYAATPREIDEQELGLLMAIGSQIGVAVENARLYREAGTLAVMAERNRLAQDLHDSVTQTIFTVNLLAGVIPMIYAENPEEARFQLEELGQLARSALNEMRALLLELHPATLAQTPLEDLLQRLGERTAASARMPVHISVERDLDVPARVRVALYRIAQEAINNVVKHSSADQAWIRLRHRRIEGNQGVELLIRDDGQGFDPGRVASGRLGLSIMRERASDIGAMLILQSAPGGGTTIRVLWYPNEQSNAEAH